MVKSKLYRIGVVSLNAEIINVGDELLSGNTLNSNAQTISKSLLSLGIKTRYTTVTGDYKSDIEEATRTALERCDLVVYTGGLGPTEDDLTKETVCEYIGLEMHLDDEILEKIKGFFSKRDIIMTDNNIKQAYVPEGSIVLENELGTADGFFIEYGDKIIVLLPGPPKEMGHMLEYHVIPLLLDATEDEIVSKTINTIGIGESQLETNIRDIIEEYNAVDIATYAKLGQSDIRITVKCISREEGEQLIEEITQKLEDSIGEFIYSFENERIEEKVFNLLRENHLTIGFCESCTGGLVSSKLTQLSGASEVLDRSIVTYSNKAKIEEVGVKPDTLEQFGAVSGETALEMARGLLKKADIDLAVSITGLAGPGGETKDKPVGLVYIALVTGDIEIVEKNIFVGSRIFIQERSSLSAFNLIRKHILTLP